MQRRFLVLVLILGVMALSARFFVNHQKPEGPSGTHLRLVEYNTPLPLNTSSVSPTSDFQSTLDNLSEAALLGKWNQVAKSMRNLDDLWQGLKPRQTGNLQLEREIDQALLALHNKVWDQDEQGVLDVAQQLTLLFSRLTS